MSGAEIVLVLGVASSVLSCIDAGKKALEKLEQLRSGHVIAEDAAIQLQSLMDILAEVASRPTHEGPMKESDKSLAREVKGCQKHIEKLRHQVEKLAWSEHDSGLVRFSKGAQALWRSGKLAEEQKALEAYRGSLTLRFTWMSAISGAPQQPNQDQGEFTYFDVPKVSVACFVERKALLSQLEDCIPSENRQAIPHVVLLLGMGGQGKTQLTLKYCQEAFVRKRYRGVFWVNASSRAAALGSFERIAGLIDPTGRNTEEAEEKIYLVQERLGSWPMPWLLVFDNFDSPDEFTDIKNFMPPYPNGVVLVTSRNSQAGRIASGAPIEVSGLTEGEALELLLSKSLLEKSDEHIAEGKAIVQRLGYHALAIDQAAAYISIKQLPLNRFLERYEQRRREILQFTPQLWEYGNTPSSTNEDSRLNAFTTWELSSLQLGDEDERKAILSLLTLAAQMGSKHLSEDIFRRATTIEPPIGGRSLSALSVVLTERMWDTSKYEDTLVKLSSLSLIESLDYESFDMGFSLHPLVSDWLGSRKDTTEYALEAALTLAGFLKSYADVDSSGLYHLPLRLRQEIMTDVENCLANLQRLEPGNSSTDDRLHMICKFYYADFYHSQRRYRDSENLFRSALPYPVDDVDLNDPDMLIFVRLWCQLLFKQKKFTQAEAGWKNLRAKLMDDQTPNQTELIDLTLKLADVYHKQGKLEDAENYCHEVLSICTETNAYHHYAARRLLGEVLQAQNRLPEAEAAFEKALDEVKHAVAPEHSRIKYYKKFLADLYWEEKKIVEAETLWREALGAFEKQQGPLFKGTLDLRMKLAMVDETRGKWESAEDGYRLAEQGYAATQQTDHPSIKEARVALDRVRAHIQGQA